MVKREKEEETTSSAIATRRGRAQEAGTPGYAVRKNRVLEVAAHHFARYGLEGAKLAAIAEEAGIERANLYYYADGRYDLYVQVLHAVKSQTVPNAETIARSRKPASVRLRLLMVDLMTDVEQNYPFLYVHYDAILLAGKSSRPADQQVEEVVELTARHFEAFRKVMMDGVRSGEFKSILSPGIMAEAAIGVIAHSHRWFDPTTSKFSGAEIGNGFADMILGGLGVAPTD